MLTNKYKMQIGSSNFHEVEIEKITKLVIDKSDFDCTLLQGCSQLEDLLIINTNFSRLDLTFVSSLSKLSAITICNNPLLSRVDFPNKENVSLEDVSIINCALVEIPNNIGSLLKLKYLDLRENFIETLDDVMFNHSIRNINLSSNKINSFRNISFQRLDVLNLNDNIICEFHVDSTVECFCIKELFLNKNKIEKFYFGIKDHTLEKLSISMNKLKAIPESLNNFKIISNLNISYNKEIKELPESVNSCFLRLNAIDISGLVDLDLEQLFSSIPAIKELNASALVLETIPKDILKLTKLKVLELNYNFLEAIPDVIANLDNLEVLEMRNNDVGSISDKVYEMKNLRRLDVSYNGLTEEQCKHAVAHFHKTKVYFLI